MLALRFASVEEITQVTPTGKIKVLPVAIEAPRIVLSRLPPEVVASAPAPEIVYPGRERIVLGLVFQRSENPDSYLQGIINTGTGEGVFEDCLSPVLPPPPEDEAETKGKMLFAADAQV